MHGCPTAFTRPPKSKQKRGNGDNKGPPLWNVGGTAVGHVSLGFSSGFLCLCADLKISAGWNMNFAYISTVQVTGGKQL